MEKSWHLIDNVETVMSPALLVYPERVEENVRRMIAILGGDVSRLRPHVKTHKLTPLLSIQIGQGITKFKCATIAEAEMLGEAGAAEVLFAYQPVGPNIQRLIDLSHKFPKTKFAAILDNDETALALGKACSSAGITMDVFVDIDVGMGRTGVAPERATAFGARLVKVTGLRFAGLHAYDGHITDPDPTIRASRCDEAFKKITQIRDELVRNGVAVSKIIAGGTPTFPMHAKRAKDVECSPGTCVLWDWSYSSKFQDLSFLHAALVLTRVVSKPAPNRLCLDLGHKAIASENPHPRVHLLELPDAKFLMHSEEHLVVESPAAEKLQVGSPIYGVPWHICPTVALYSEAFAIRNRRADELWSVTARARKLSI